MNSKKKKKIKDYNKIIFDYCKSNNLYFPIPEYKFHNDRNWRFDFCWVKHKIALEIEGGIFIQGRHVRPKGFIDDMEKYNNAIDLGYKLFRCHPNNIIQVLETCIRKNIIKE